MRNNKPRNDIMNKLPIKNVIIVISIILIIILVGIYLFKQTEMPSTNIPVNQNFTEQQKKVIAITLENALIKSQLNGRIYEINTVNIDQYKLNNISLSTVQILVKNNDGSLDYHIDASVDLQNNTIYLITQEKPKPV